MKSIKIILCICFGILISNTTIMASTSQTNTVVETFSDGSYIESSISFPSTSKALSSFFYLKLLAKPALTRITLVKHYGLLQ